MVTRTSYAGHTSVRPPHRRHAALAAAVLAAASAAHAGQVWDGGSLTSDNWSDTANWDLNTAPPTNLVLQFAGTTRLTPFQDFAAGRGVAGITFVAGAGAFTLSGNSIALNGSVINSSGVTQTINFDISTTAGAKETTATSADIVYNGKFTGSGILRTPTAGGVAGTVYFNGANEHTGGIQAHTNAQIALGNDAAVGNGGVLLFGGGLVRASGGARTIANALQLSNNSTVNGSLALTFTGTLTNTAAGDRSLTVSNSDLTTFTTVNLSNSVTSRKVIFAGTGAIDITSTVADGSTSIASGLTYNGTNTLRLLNTANTYRGATTIGLGGTIDAVSLGAGGLNSSIGASTNAAANLVLNGGTLKYSGAGATAVDRSFTLGLDGGAIDASGGALTWAPLALLGFTNVNVNRTFTLTGTSVQANTYAGIIANPVGTGVLSLAKSGNCTWILSAANTYTGATAITGGTLLVTGSTHAGSTVNLQAGTLGGSGDGSTTGKIGGAVNVGNDVLNAGQRDATLAPGPGIGTLLSGNLTFFGDGKFAVDLDGTTSGTSDRVVVSGSVDLGDELAALDVAYSSGTLAAGQKYFILVNDSNDAIAGGFEDLSDPNGAISTDDPIVMTNGTLDLLISYTGDFGSSALTGGNDVVLYTANSVPEPGVLGLLGVATAGLLLRRRRR